ncbi:MAG: heavy metal translocating P-type ATPase metal-binding domain-containing protein, partial [Campylobacter sp.]|nr:heavy metal translocating P-type ATPase metal-binding domain-containing protein [Campylobacter sp.]
MAHEKCSHCRQSFDENALMIDEIGNKFCCNGCKQVFYLLKENGLDDFYNRLGKNTLNAAKIREFSANETQGIYDNFVRKTADGFNEIFIIIDGIHCTACVWLNEKVLFNTAGIVEASINA